MELTSSTSVTGLPQARREGQAVPFCEELRPGPGHEVSVELVAQIPANASLRMSSHSLKDWSDGLSWRTVSRSRLPVNSSANSA